MMEKQSLLVKAKRYIMQCRRVLRITQKPNMEEFKSIVKITGIGMLAIGFIGFLVIIAAHYLKTLGL